MFTHSTCRESGETCTKSANLEDVLVKLSQTSDFNLTKLEDLKSLPFTPQITSLHFNENFRENNKTQNFNLFDKTPVMTFFEILQPYKQELAACILSYVGLLCYSLIKGGKGFKR